MLLKPLKLAVLTSAGALMIGGAIFGKEVFSYVNSSARSVRDVVKESVPVEFQLRRARDLVNDIVPEMHANVRLIAQQEIEIEALQADIEQSRVALGEERQRVAKLADSLGTANVSFTFGEVKYSRDQVKDDLARRFNGMKEAEVVLASKERLLANRQQSLASATQMLQRTKGQKSLLESQIAALEAQNQLVRTAAIGSEYQIDGSKLAQSERLIAEIKKQLDVAERVLAHQSTFIQPIQIDVVSDKDLLEEVKEHLNSEPQTQTQTAQR